MVEFDINMNFRAVERFDFKPIVIDLFDMPLNSKRYFPFLRDKFPMGDRVSVSLYNT